MAASANNRVQRITEDKDKPSILGSKKQNVKINVPQMIEFLDELSHAGLTGTEYRSISNEEILEDYLTYIKYL